MREHLEIFREDTTGRWGIQNLTTGGDVITGLESFREAEDALGRNERNAMNDFTPIPGVWYTDPETDIWYLYAPSRGLSDKPTYPWWSNDTQMWELDDDVPVKCLEILHNPHPPTRTEWGARHEDYTIVLHRAENMEAAKAAKGSHESLCRRQVTEWVEVDDA